MFYAIRHFTRYRYSHFVWQSMMEVRMHPRSEGNQRCFVFQLSVNPRARIFGYTDSYGNLVHHFDLPSRHGQLTIVSDALVNIDAQPAIPEVMEYEGWHELEELIEKKDYWDMLMPSALASWIRSSGIVTLAARRTDRDGPTGDMQQRRNTRPILPVPSPGFTAFDKRHYAEGQHRESANPGKRPPRGGIFPARSCA